MGTGRKYSLTGTYFICKGIFPARAYHKRQTGRLSGAAEKCSSQYNNFRYPNFSHWRFIVWTDCYVYFLFQYPKIFSLSSVYGNRRSYYNSVCIDNGKSVFLVCKGGCVWF